MVNRIIHLGLRTVDGMRRRPWLYSLSLFTLAAAFLSFTATLTAAVNLDALLAKWAGSGEMTVYLSESATEEDLTRLSAAVSKIDAVSSVTPVTPTMAKARFANDLGALGDMAQTLPTSAFPYSIDVHLTDPEAHNFEARRVLAKRIGNVGMVKEVELYDDWFSRLSALTLVGRISAWGLGLIALVVAILVVTAMTRTGINARSREIQVLGLVGATDRNVRLPFLLEGILEAVAAMVIALVSLHFLTNFAETIAGDFMSLIGAASLVRLPPTTILLLLIGSALTGLVGARISLRGVTSSA
jgi:cell division transport system permease protein